MKVIIAGSRDFINYDLLCSKLDIFFSIRHLSRLYVEKQEVQINLAKGTQKNVDITLFPSPPSGINMVNPQDITEIRKWQKMPMLSWLFGTDPQKVRQI